MNWCAKYYTRLLEFNFHVHTQFALQNTINRQHRPSSLSCILYSLHYYHTDCRMTTENPHHNKRTPMSFKHTRALKISVAGIYGRFPIHTVCASGGHDFHTRVVFFFSFLIPPRISEDKNKINLMLRSLSRRFKNKSRFNNRPSIIDLILHAPALYQQ